MTETPTQAIELPLERTAGCPYEPPAGLAPLREQQPLTRMRFPDGHLGWLATSHELVRAVLADPRFSARYELLHDPLNNIDLSKAAAPAGDFGGMDAPEHTRLRRHLMAKFTVRRMRLLTTRIEQICAERLAAMALLEPPVDLIEVYALPIPSLAICELLGVPYDDRELFHSQLARIMDPESFEQVLAALSEMTDYIRELVESKRLAPTDDLLSELTTTDLSDDELAGIGAFLLGAGMETTRTMIALGTFTLLRHPDQFAALRTDPDLAAGAVEELLRYLTIAHTTTRAALVDVELGGQLIKAGESVSLSLVAANRDPNRFQDPETLDVYRRATGHVAFGHGIHQCLGQQLARVELGIALPALATHFPTLALAVPPEDVPVRYGNILSLHRLPVTW